MAENVRQRVTAAAGVQLDFERLVDFDLAPPEHRQAQQIAAERREDELDREERDDVFCAASAREHDRHGLVRGREKHRHERRRGEIARRKQGACRRREAALRNASGECADRGAELCRAREQGGRIGQPVFDII